MLQFSLPFSFFGTKCASPISGEFLALYIALPIASQPSICTFRGGWFGCLSNQDHSGGSWANSIGTEHWMWRWWPPSQIFPVFIVCMILMSSVVLHFLVYGIKWGSPEVHLLFGLLGRQVFQSLFFGPLTINLSPVPCGLDVLYPRSRPTCRTWVNTCTGLWSSLVKA